MGMFGGMGKHFGGIAGILFINQKVASKKLHQNRLFHTTSRDKIQDNFPIMKISKFDIRLIKMLLCSVV